MPEQQYLAGGEFPAFRVKDKDTGHKYTVSVVDPEFHTVLHEDAVDAAGVALPAEHHVTPAQQKKIDAATEGSSK